MIPETTRRSLLKQFGTGVAIIAGGTGTVAARKHNGKRGRKGASTEKDIVETADDLGFTTLLTAVDNADPVVAQH